MRQFNHPLKARVDKDFNTLLITLEDLKNAVAECMLLYNGAVEKRRELSERLKAMPKEGKP